jgi:GxxExxY protein
LFYASAFSTWKRFYSLILFFNSNRECFAFQEVIYQRALAIEFQENDISFQREFEMPIYYRNNHIGTRRVDFLVNDNISVEIKALISIEDVHFAQAINYLEAYNLEVGLLVNFGERSLKFHRLTNKKFKIITQD